MKHVVDTVKNEWFHIDEDNRVWTCGCKTDAPLVSLCLTLDESLKKEGELRELDRTISLKRKELGLKHGEPMPTI